MGEVLMIVTALIWLALLIFLTSKWKGGWN